MRYKLGQSMHGVSTSLKVNINGFTVCWKSFPKVRGYKIGVTSSFKWPRLRKHSVNIKASPTSKRLCLVNSAGSFQLESHCGAFSGQNLRHEFQTAESKNCIDWQTSSSVCNTVKFSWNSLCLNSETLPLRLGPTTNWCKIFCFVEKVQR